MLARTIETTVGPHTVRAPDGTLCAGFGSPGVVVAPSVALAMPDPGCLLRELCAQDITAPISDTATIRGEF